MKRIFLASSVDVTAKAIADEIQKEFGADKKRLLFITTASELKKQQDLGWQNDDRKSLTNAGFEVTDWTIAGKSGDEIQQIIETFDVIHFNGGNVFYLLKQLQLTNSIDIFRKAVESGKIYTGSSAGSMIASPNILPAKTLDKIEDAKKLKDFSGMAIVDFLVMPHWGSDHFKEKYSNDKLSAAYGGRDKIILLRDSQYVSVRDDRYKIVSV